MSRWTFSSISFTDPAAENPDENAGGALKVSAITGGTVYPNQDFKFKCLIYQPEIGANLEVNLPPNSKSTLEQIDQQYTESETETVRLEYGKGSLSFPDWNGNTNVYESQYKAEFLAYTDKTYTRYYREVTVSASEPGTHEIVIGYSNGTHQTIVSYDVVAPPPQLVVELINPQAQYIVGGDQLDEIRVYFYHYYLDAFTDVIAGIEAGDDTHVARVSENEWQAIIQEAITETITLHYGRGQYTYWDLDGIRDYFNAAYENQAEASVEVTYNIEYYKFLAYPLSAGMKKITWKWTDNSASAELDFEAIDCNADHPELCNETTCVENGMMWVDGQCLPEPPPVLNPQTLTIRRWYSKTILPGALVWVDGVYLGAADENGQIITPPQEPGTSHDVKFTHQEIIDSDGDNFENDSYIAGVPNE